MVNGYIHSFESLGAVDGPNIRFVVFMQGCPLRCIYCHNPDTWNMKSAKYVMKADALMRKILEYKAFISDGGVTISGGEPLLQPVFCEELLALCRQNKLHTAIDTSGAIKLEKSAAAISLCDLLLLDIKDIDEDDCKTLTGMGNHNSKKTLSLCELIGKPVWLRHVLLPDYTLNDEKLKRLAEFLCGFECIEKIELLPYHNMGAPKWKALGMKYETEFIKPPNLNQVEAAKEIFKQYDRLKGKI